MVMTGTGNFPDYSNKNYQLARLVEWFLLEMMKFYFVYAECLKYIIAHSIHYALPLIDHAIKKYYSKKSNSAI